MPQQSRSCMRKRHTEARTPTRSFPSCLHLNRNPLSPGTEKSGAASDQDTFELRRLLRLLRLLSRPGLYMGQIWCSILPASSRIPLRILATQHQHTAQQSKQATDSCSLDILDAFHSSKGNPSGQGRARARLAALHRQRQRHSRHRAQAHKATPQRHGSCLQVCPRNCV